MGQGMQKHRHPGPLGPRILQDCGSKFRESRCASIGSYEAAGGHKTESSYRCYAIVSEGDLFEGFTKPACLHASQQLETEPTGVVASLENRKGKAVTLSLPPAVRAVPLTH